MKIGESSFFQVIRKLEFLIFLILIIASISLTGWLLGIKNVNSVSSDFIPIAPSSSLFFFLLSFVLIVKSIIKKSLFTQTIVFSIVLLVSLFCLLILLDYTFSFKWDIESIFIPNPEKFGDVPKGRMSPITALLFLFTCASIVIDLQKTSNTLKYIGGILSLLTCFVATVLVSGYLYKSPLLYGSTIIPVSLLSAICFLLFSIALLRVYDAKFWMFSLVNKNQTKYLLLKTFLPLVVFIVVLQGYLETNFSTNHSNPTLYSALVILIIIVLTIIIVVRASAILGDKLMNAENKLRESEEFSRYLLKTIPFGMDIVDEKGVVLLQSENFKKFFGERAIGEKCWTLYRDDKIQCNACPLRRGIKVGETDVYESVGVLGGKIFEIVHTGMMFEGKKAMLEIFIDITERKQSEMKLRENEIQYRHLADSGMALIWTAGVDKLCNYFNEPWLRFTGRSLEQEMGNGWAEGVHPDDFDRCLKTYVNAFDKRESFTMEYRLRNANGEYKWLLDKGTPNYNIKGEFIGYIGHCFDISELKEAAAEIMLKNKQLQNLNIEKDKFFSIISHDLRSPFNGFLGLTQIIAEDLPKLTMSEVKDIVVSMRNSAANLFRLLENLLEWAKMQQGLIPFEPKVVKLLPVVQECISILSESARKKDIEISGDIPDDLEVFADINLLQTVIRNLVSNALKFTQKGGKVAFTAKYCDHKSVEISVKDNGIGMSKERIENLFRLDVKTNRKGTEGEPSSGLGLLLCKEFIEKHGGMLWVESNPDGLPEDKGSVFYFTLPYA
jgi:PAS domain S-box-containing protein